MKSEYNDEIDLIELFWKIVYNWRAIVVAMLVGAVVIGLGKYAMDAKTAVKNNEEAIRQAELAQHDKEAAEAEKQTSIEDKLTEAELNAVLEATNTYKTLSYKEDYYNKSIYMNIDPYNRYTTYLWYRVELDPDRIRYNDLREISTLSIHELNEIVDLYKDYVVNRGIQKELEGVLGKDISVQYVSELIGAGISTTGVFYVSVIGQNAEQTEAVAKQVDDLIQRYQLTLADGICEHILTKVDEYTNTVTDTGLATAQENYRTSIINLRKSLATLTGAFNADQKKLYENYMAKINVDAGDVNFSTDQSATNDTESNNDNLVSSVNTAETNDGTSLQEVELEKAKLSVKYIILGALVGLVLCAGWIACVYIFSGKIKDSTEIQNRYGLRVLGDVEVDGKKKKALSGVDTFLDKLRRKEVVSMEDSKAMVMVNIKLLLKNSDIKTLLLTSSSLKSENEKALVSAIITLCKKENVNCVYEENLTRNIQAIEELASKGNVILLIKDGCSTVQMLEDELRICKEQKATVLGVVNVK